MSIARTSEGLQTVCMVAIALFFAQACLPALSLAASHPTQLELATQRARDFEQNIMAWRLAIAACALLVVGLPLLFRARSGRRAGTAANASRVGVIKTGALIFLAFGAYASYYDFFEPKFGVGFKDTDVFHYYMGSKYFSEVGYFDLYHCTLIALLDLGVESRFELPDVRDMHTLRIHTPETALHAARECKQQFESGRWSSFASDVAWFEQRFEGRQWRLVLRDHGYNPSPIWNAIGGALTSRIALEGAAFDWLIRSDRILMVICFGAIVWAFGMEVGALSAIAWGTGQHWGYSWIGDSLLRNLWLFAVVCGLCLLKKNRNWLAGGLLSLASLLRVFPSIFLAGFFLQAWFRRRVEQRWPTPSRDVAVGVAVASALLLLWAVLASDWGMAAFFDFSEKIAVFTDQKSLNKLGLTSLVWRTIMMQTGHMMTGSEGQLSLLPFSPAWLPFAIRGAQLLVVVPALLLYIRAVKRLRGWEAAALSFALIPLLSDPANYYYGFVICGALLAADRPRLQIYLMWSCVLWIANGLYFYRVHEEYVGASIIAVLYPLAVLYEMSREAAASEDVGGVAPVSLAALPERLGRAS